GGGNSGSGLAITSGASSVSISHVASTGNSGNGLAIDTTGAISNLSLDNVDFSSNTNDGLRFPTSMASLDGLTITNSHFDHNGFAGMEIYGPPSTGAFKNVSIMGSTFSHDTTKGIYAERLSHATLDGLTVDSSGTSGTGSAGIDLNLKKQAFTDITIENSTIQNSGTGDPTNGVGVTIKSRDDGANGPTSVDGMTLTHNTITGNQFGLRLGEPTKNNVGPTTVHINRNNISGNVSGAGATNVSQTSADATCNWWGAATGPSGAGSGTGDSVSSGYSFVPWLTSSNLDGSCAGSPILGKTSIGASSAAGGGGFLVLTGPVTLASAAPASKLTGYVQGGSSAANVRAVIYADNGSNAPGSFVAVSSQVAVAAGQAAGWVDFSFPVAPNLSAGKYWLGYWLGGTVIVFYDNQANAGRYRAATYLASGDP